MLRCQVYPMYDYTHCISDAVEGITHSLCTLEFADHRPLYDWVLDSLKGSGLVDCHPQQIEFSRLNLREFLFCVIFFLDFVFFVFCVVGVPARPSMRPFLGLLNEPLNNGGGEAPNERTKQSINQSINSDD